MMHCNIQKTGYVLIVNGGKSAILELKINETIGSKPRKFDTQTWNTDCASPVTIGFCQDGQNDFRY